MAPFPTVHVGGGWIPPRFPCWGSVPAASCQRRELVQSADIVAVLQRASLRTGFRKAGEERELTFSGPHGASFWRKGCGSTAVQWRLLALPCCSLCLDGGMGAGAEAGGPAGVGTPRLSRAGGSAGALRVVSRSPRWNTDFSS